ncbi:solute carrier family 49 member 4 protein [Pelomyxa schiedti]|nr:solute carrier family 49 member 4 protein [Pelomyxa schiedti]
MDIQLLSSPTASTATTTTTTTSGVENDTGSRDPQPSPPSTVVVVPATVAVDVGGAAVAVAVAVEAEGERDPPKSKARLWVLGLFFSVAFMQSNIWMTYGPIAPPAQELYEDSLSISLLAAWGPIMYLPATVLSSWLMDKTGMKLSMVLNAALVAGGALLRCVSQTPPAGAYFAHIGQIFNALAGPFCMSAPPLLSSIWFPLKVRTSTTAIGALAGNFGIVVCFTTGLFVTKPEHVKLLLWGEAAIAVFLFAFSIFYFPAYPHDDTLRSTCNRYSWTHISPAPSHETASGTPDVELAETGVIQVAVVPETPAAVITSASPIVDDPTTAPIVTTTEATTKSSKSASALQFWRDLKTIMLQPAFVVVALACGCTVGMFSGWQAILLLVLEPLGFTQSQVGWMGFISTFFGIFVGLLSGRIADWTGRTMKPVALTLFAGLSLSSLMFCLIVNGIIPTKNIAPAYAIIVILTGFLSSMMPVLYELSVDITYPIAPSTSCSVINTIINVGCLVFLAVNGSLSPQILNWSLAGTATVFGLSLISIKWKYTRTKT